MIYSLIHMVKVIISQGQNSIVKAFEQTDLRNNYTTISISFSSYRSQGQGHLYVKVKTPFSIYRVLYEGLW